MAVKMGTLPEPESGTKRPKPTTHKNDALRHGAICRTIKALAILRCLNGSEMVLLGVVIRKYETPITNISQENGHRILMITCRIELQLELNYNNRITTRDKQQWTYFSFFSKSFC